MESLKPPICSQSARRTSDNPLETAVGGCWDSFVELILYPINETPCPC